MNLHHDKENFGSLITVTAGFIGIPEIAVKRDYYIVLLLQNLQNSEYAELSVFKGGTSLSKCYPGSINRFSEDIDLTFIPIEDMTSKQYDKALGSMEKAIIGFAFFEKNNDERNNRNKSSNVWFDNDDKDSSKIKLEIGSSIKPDPYKKLKLKTYIQEYLESNHMFDAVKEFALEEVEINVLCIERTFIDKVFAVKRHAICGKLERKVRHIYDVTRLFEMPQIQVLLNDRKLLKEIVENTKNTDSFYLEKRDIYKGYNPIADYDFSSWKVYLNDAVKERYEKLHEDLLYGNEKQNFEDAIKVLTKINQCFAEIDE